MTFPIFATDTSVYRQKFTFYRSYDFSRWGRIFVCLSLKLLVFGGGKSTMIDVLLVVRLCDVQPQVRVREPPTSGGFLG